MKYWVGILSGALLAALLLTGVNVSANVNNFKISSFDINYHLDKDENGASRLRTTEKIQARFPFTRQNRGIERAIPVKFDGRKLPLTINSIKDADGKDHMYSERGMFWSDIKVVRIGNPDRYARGLNVYNIDYTQLHVTKYFEDTGKTEWYWDTNGTGWKVPIEELNITINIDDAVLASLESGPFCYMGAAGSTDRCDITEESSGVYKTSAKNLRPGENITVAFGFSEGTFSKYEPSQEDRLFDIWIWMTVITTIVGIGVIVWLGISYSRRNNRTKDTVLAPVQYIPPRDYSITAAAQVYSPKHGEKSVFSAQLIDLAVRRYIKVIETTEKKFLLSADYRIEIAKDLSSLRSEEKEILQDMFNKEPKVGESIGFHDLRYDFKYPGRLRDNKKKLLKLVLGDYGLRGKDAKTSSYFHRWFIVLLIVAVLTFSPVLLVAAIVAVIMGATIKPLTDKGLELRRYILGFEKYIKAAEAERLAFLQGPDTAEKVGEAVDVNDKGQVLKLYERALPYAVLYGHEKEWTKRLGEYYRDLETEPDWYVGRTAFNAAVFSSAISSFSSSASSYSSHSDSSSSGGSSGGGYSGGGGGGGGGGGW